jgi:hypothetical protein
MQVQVGDQFVRQVRRTGRWEVVGTVTRLPTMARGPYLVKFYGSGHEAWVAPGPEDWFGENVRIPNHPSWTDRHHLVA